MTYNRTVSDVFSYGNATVSLLLAIIIVFANFSIILIFVKFKKVRDMNNTAVTLLSIGDMLRGTVVMLPKIYNHFALATSLVGVLCYPTAITSAFSFVFNPMILAMIAVIRYCKISPSVNRYILITEKRFKIAVCSIFLTSIFFAFLPIMGVGEYNYSPSHGVCFTDWRESNKPFRIIFYIIVVGLAFPILTVCYALLYWELRKHTINILSNYKTRGSQSEDSSTAIDTPKKVTSTVKKSEAGEIQNTPTISIQGEQVEYSKENGNGSVFITDREISVDGNSDMPSTMGDTYDDNRMNRQMNTVAKKLSKQDYQVTKLMIIIFIAYCVCWIPAAVVNIMAFATGGQTNLGPEVYYIIVTLVEVKSALNPLIYGLGNRKYRRAFKKLVKTYLHLPPCWNQ